MSAACYTCGNPMFITPDGVAHHGGADGVDHDADAGADHIAIDDAQLEPILIPEASS